MAQKSKFLTYKILLVSLFFTVSHLALFTTPVLAQATNEEDANQAEEQEQTNYTEKEPGFRDENFMSSNKVEFFDPSCSQLAGGGGGSVQLEGKDNEEKILNFFMEKGLSLAQASGFIGNMIQESGLKPDIEQGGRIVDENYIPINGVGFGLVQWTFTARQAPLQAKVKELGVPITDLGGQLEFVWTELNGEWKSNTLDPLMAIDDPVAAAVLIHDTYEISADSPSEVVAKRGGYAKEVFDKHSGKLGGGGGGGGSSSSDAGSGDCGGEGSGGKVNAEGYAFPIGLPKDDVSPSGKEFPCESDTFCGHHDNTPAFDLSDKEWGTDSSVGVPVIAIFDGKIERLSNRNGHSHCWDFQLVGDDGWWYWYGHNTNATVENGATVKAGQQIAEVGPTECADSTPSHLHIDRGEPKGNHGGSVGSRNPEMVPLINSLWEGL